jgi:hypothetical protein
MDVGGWRKSLGLGQYEALFRASGIDADILPELMDVDLEKLGVPLGRRKRLLRAISGLAAAEISAVKRGNAHDRVGQSQRKSYCRLIRMEAGEWVQGRW